MTIDIKKNGKGEVIRSEISDWKDKTYLGIRVFYPKDNEMKPSNKGISIPIDIAREVVNAADKVLREAGL